MSFYNTGNPVPSIDPRDLDDNAKIIDVVATSTELSTTDRKGRAIRTLAGLQYDASQGTLRTDLAAPDGSGLVGYKGRTQYQKNEDEPFAEDFGAIGDKTYHPLSEIYASVPDAQAAFPLTASRITSLSQSIDWAAIQECLRTHGVANLRKTGYVLTDTLLLPIASALLGRGGAGWSTGGVLDYNDIFSDSTDLIFIGDGAKQWLVNHVSDLSGSGIFKVNGSAAEPFYANAPTPDYRLTDLTNKNAVGITAATPRALSIAVKVESRPAGTFDDGRGIGGNVVISDLRIIPYFDGLNGYRNLSTLGIGDKWDVGLHMDNTYNSRVSNVKVVGYWRDAALLKTTLHDYGAGGRSNGEQDIFESCMFQGWSGATIRGIDSHIVKAVDVPNNQFSIGWANSHTFPPSGTIYNGGIAYNYSSLIYDVVNNYLVFQLTGSVAAFAVNQNIRINLTSNGTSGTTFLKSTFIGFCHGTRNVATSTDFGGYFAGAGRAYECSGALNREIKMIGCYFTTREDIMMFLGQADQNILLGCKMEAASGYDKYFRVNTLPAGARFIGFSTGTFRTENQRHLGCTYVNVDIRSASSVARTPPRFATVGDTGCFTPYEYFDDALNFTYLSNGSNYDLSITHKEGGNVGIGTTVSVDSNVISNGTNLNLYGKGSVNLGIRTSNTAAVNNVIKVDGGGIYPINASRNLATGSVPFGNIFSESFNFSASRKIYTGSVAPEGVQTAWTGSLFLHVTSSSGTGKLYVKESGSGNTGWVLK